MKKILWLSRHEPLPAQIRELKALFGKDTEIIKDERSFDTADDIVQRFHDWNADEIVVVAPLSVISQLTQRGIKPLWAEMKAVQDDKFHPDTDVIVPGTPARHMRFQRFRRIKRVALEFEEVKQGTAMKTEDVKKLKYLMKEEEVSKE